MNTVLALIAGSIAGGFARYYLAGALQKSLGTAFPWGTLTVNLIGCFLIGIFSVLAESKWSVNPEMKILLMTGFCGAFTTFSTFMLETSGLTSNGEFIRALVYVVASVVAGFILFRAGVSLGGSL